MSRYCPEKKALLLLVCLSVSLSAFAQKSAEPEPAVSNTPVWGFSGSLGIGGMRLSGDGLDPVREAGYGNLSKESITMQATGGVICRVPGLLDVSLLLSYLGGGSFMWEDIFGDYGSDFSLYGDSLGVQVELQPTFPFLRGFQPFIGAGCSLTNGLVDDYQDGFVAGRGPFIVGGLYVLNSLGLDPYLPFYRDEASFFGLRISVYYRFPYNYRFRMDWDEYSQNYVGPVDANIMRDFFENTTFTMSSLAFAVELCLGGSGK